MKRPSITPAIIREAAALVVDDMNLSDREAKEWIDGIVKNYYGQFMDGFDLGKALDLDGFHVTALIIEHLDCVGDHVSELHRKHCWQWVKHNDIQPPHPVGVMTTKGLITGVSETLPAYYQIRESAEDDSDGHHRRLLVKFEDVVLAENTEAVTHA